MQADHQHRPFILVRATQLGDFIVHETSEREGIASDSPSGKCKCLPGVPYVVQAVPICPFSVLPSLAPHNTRQDEDNWRRVAGQPRFKRAAPALLRHVPGWIVVIQPIWPVLQASCDKVEFRWVQIPGRWIHSQRVFISAGRSTLGRAYRGAIEEQLREESRSVTHRCAAKGALKHIECWDFRS